MTTEKSAPQPASFEALKITTGNHTSDASGIPDKPSDTEESRGSRKVFPYPQRSEFTAEDLSQVLINHAGRSLKGLPRSVTLTVNLSEVEIAQVIATSISSVVRRDPASKTEYSFNGKVWEPHPNAIRQMVQGLLCESHLANGLIKPPFISVVRPPKETAKRRKIEQAAIAAGLAEFMEIDGEDVLVNKGTNVEFELLEENRITDRSRINAISDLVQTDPAIVVTADEWDCDAHLLNCPAGIINLNTGVLEPHRPDAMCTQMTAGSPRDDNGLAMAKIRKFFDTTLEDPDVIDYLQRVIGLSLRGEVIEHLLITALGAGRNGKSVFFSAFIRALGSYAVKLSPTVIQPSRPDEHPTKLMDLKGRRFCVVSEPKADTRWDTATVKDLTGGEDVKARGMGQDFQTFKPCHTIFVQSNYRPEIGGSDPAFWARIREIPFNKKFVPEGSVLKPGEEIADPNLLRDLESQECMDALVTWAIEGHRKYLDSGLCTPNVVVQATREAQTKGSEVEYFSRQAFELDPASDGVPASVAFKVWELYKDRDLGRNSNVRPNTSRQIDVVARALGVEYVPAPNGKTPAKIMGIRLSDFALELVEDIERQLPSSSGGLGLLKPRVVAEYLDKELQLYKRRQYSASRTEVGATDCSQPQPHIALYQQ